MSNAWYVVQCKPRQEELAADNLRRQAFHVYLPRLRTRVRRGGRWVFTDGPLFPRYLFVRVNSGQQSISVIRSTRGAIGLLRFGGEPAVVTETVIAAILNREDPTLGLHVAAAPSLTHGARVKLAEGPLEGVEGIFFSEDGDERAILLIELLGKTNRLRVRKDWLAAAA